MICLSSLLERSIDDAMAIVVVGETKNGDTRKMFSGTALSAYQHRGTKLKHCWYKDVVGIDPCMAKVDGERVPALKLTVFFEYGFRDDD